MRRSLVSSIVIGVITGLIMGHFEKKRIEAEKKAMDEALNETMKILQPSPGQEEELARKFDCETFNQKLDKEVELFRTKYKGGA